MTDHKHRPELPQEIRDGVFSDAELFQNTVLRPIIKMQSDVLIRHVSTRLLLQKVEWSRLTSIQQRETLIHLLGKDKALKHEIIGMVVGQFSRIEYQDFTKQQKELNRRLTQIVLSRCVDQLVNSRLPSI